MSTETFDALGVVVAAAIAGIISYRIARQGRRADKETEFTKALLTRVDQLNGRVRDLEEREDSLRRRIDAVEDELDTERRWRHLATEYIRVLRRTLRVHSIDTPEPPAGLSID